MKNTLIASVLAFAVALSGLSATPARAGEDFGKILAGVATIFIIGKALENARDNGAKNNTSRSGGNRQAHYDDDYRYDRYDRYGDRPRRCLRQKYRNGKWVTYRDKQCLKRDNRRAEKPRQCLRKRWTRDGWKKYYDRRCLKRHNGEARYRDDYRWDRRSK